MYLVIQSKHKYYYIFSEQNIVDILDFIEKKRESDKDKLYMKYFERCGFDKNIKYDFLDEINTSQMKNDKYCVNYNPKNIMKYMKGEPVKKIIYKIKEEVKPSFDPYDDENLKVKVEEIEQKNIEAKNSLNMEGNNKKRTKEELFKKYICEICNLEVQEISRTRHEKSKRHVENLLDS
jgi:hypothetical protein